MSRGYGRPPKWALVAIVVGLLVIGVLGAAQSRRTDAGRIPADEIARLNAQQQRNAEEFKAQQAAKASAAEDALKAHITFPTDRPLQVLFMGDSVTSGSYSTKSHSFADLVTAGLQEHGEVAAHNLAVGGQTVTQALNVERRGPYDLAVLMFGNNDVAKSTADAYARDLAALLAQLKDESPGITIVCLPPWVGNGYIGPGGVTVGSIVQATKTACDTAKVTFVGSLVGKAGGPNNAQVGDVLPGGYVVEDNGHPNDKGHAMIAQAVLAMISVKAP